MNQHVRAGTVTVGEVGTLSRLEVQSKTSRFAFCVTEQFIEGEVECLVRCVRACDALEPECC